MLIKKTKRKKQKLPIVKWGENKEEFLGFVFLDNGKSKWSRKNFELKDIEIIRQMDLKVRVIEELKENTTNFSLNEYLEEYGEAYRKDKVKEYEMDDIDKIIDYIVSEVDNKQFEIKGWG